MKNHIIISLLFLSVGFGQKKFTTTSTIRWENGEMFETIDTTYLVEEYNIENLLERDGVYFKKFSDENVNGKVFKMYDDMKVPLGQMKDGKKEGKWVTWYDSGTKKEEHTFKDGEYDGLWIIWYENGQKRFEGTYKDGKQDGLSTNWYENGQKKSEGTYKDGERDGLWIIWFENGQKQREETYKDGKEVGLWTIWYENGQKWLEINYKGGKLDGLHTIWYENGQKRREETFKDGEKISSKCWDEDGNDCECSEEWWEGCK